MTDVTEQIRERRKDRGWTQAELARQVGTSQQTVDKIERGLIKKGHFYDKILRWLDIATADSVSAQPHAAPITIPSAFLTGGPDLPVYGAECKEGGGGFLMSVMPVLFDFRPAPLSNVTGAYGIIVPDDTMFPEFAIGDTVLVHPHLPAVAGHSAVFFDKAEPAGASAVIRHIVEATSAGWLVKTWNVKPGSKAQETLSKAHWPRAHRIVGRFTAR